MTKKAENIIVGISIGDLNGIGGEVILKTFEDPRMLELCTPVIFANLKTMSYLKKTFHLTANFNTIDTIEQVVHGKINILTIWQEVVSIAFGENNSKVGEYAIQSFIAGSNALKENKIDALVTAPINKYNIQSENYKFPGHTDYLDQELEGNALMLMVQGNLKVGLLTDHLPITEVASHLTEELIEKKIETIKQTIIQDFSINRPKIAVLGLNPHCGDGGVIGKEDDEIIRPVLKKLFDKGTYVFGPFAADAFFGSQQYLHYDAVIATYHDQGLIPFKTLSFGKGVNYTAGLNKIRTSPDHGTAYDIAGKGLADHNSFKEAVYLAIEIHKNREQHAEITQNPLKIKQK